MKTYPIYLMHVAADSTGLNGYVDIALANSHSIKECQAYFLQSNQFLMYKIKFHYLEHSKKLQKQNGLKTDIHIAFKRLHQSLQSQTKSKRSQAEMKGVW